MEIIYRNYIAECRNGQAPQRLKSRIDTIMLHRIAPSIGKDAKEIATWFAETGYRWTGSRIMPYHFIIPEVWSVEPPEVHQALALTSRSPHALTWNTRAIAVAVVGDFRRSQASSAQQLAIISVCRRIMDTIGRELRVVGHTNVPKSTSDPKKVCPGPHLHVASLGGRIYKPGRIIV